MLDGTKLCGLRSNGKRLRNVAFTTINTSTTIVMVLAESLDPNRWVNNSATKIPTTTDPNLINGVENMNRGNEKMPTVNERSVGCNLEKLVRLTAAKGRIAWRHLLIPRAKRIGRGERYSILHNWVSLIAGVFWR